MQLGYLLSVHFRVIGADIEDWKLKLAQEMGTDVVINTKTQNIKEVQLTLLTFHSSLLQIAY